MTGMIALVSSPTTSASFDPTVLLAWLTCLGALGGIAITLIKYGRNYGRKIMQMVEDFNGTEERPGVPSRPGVMARLQTLDEQVAAVHTEVNYNHGTTIKDAITRIETDVKGIHDKMDGKN
jgi:hypothetical protein